MQWLYNSDFTTVATQKRSNTLGVVKILYVTRVNSCTIFVFITKTELSSFIETQTQIMIGVLEENTEPAVFRDALHFLRNAEPQTDESKRKLASGVTGSVDETIPEGITRDSEATSSSKEEKTGRRRKRAVEDDTSSEEEEEEEEEEPGMTIDEVCIECRFIS